MMPEPIRMGVDVSTTPLKTHSNASDMYEGKGPNILPAPLDAQVSTTRPAVTDSSSAARLEPQRGRTLDPAV